MTSPQMVALPSAVSTMDVHRALGVGAGGFAIAAGEELDRPGEFEILEAQRALGVEPVDQMLDVGRRILRMHQAGDGIFRARGG